MSPASTRKPKAWRGLLGFCIAALVVDWVVVQSSYPLYWNNNDGYPVHSRPLTLVDGRLTLSDGTDGVGRARVFMKDKMHGTPWAPIERRLSVALLIIMNDGSDPSEADRLGIAAQYADERQQTDERDALLRQGGGERVESLPWGYVHSAIATIAALGAIACLVVAMVERQASANTR
jgi:hypothetical protein